jgi:aminopeptidase N
MAPLGFTITKNGSAWDMQEPYGAFTWYAVNDQPADKAFYDMTLRTVAPMVGVGNGRLVADWTVNGVRTTCFHLAEPAASYLTTVEFGNYVHRYRGTVDGVPVTTWTKRGSVRQFNLTKPLPRLLRWVTNRLGRYPFPTLNLIVVPADDGMETQEAITMGNTRYDLLPQNLVHEIIHQWYGDAVTPNDWKDVWMNEGMAMYLQQVWMAQKDGLPAGYYVRHDSSWDAFDRRFYGPPGNYLPNKFAQSNVYYVPAKMWYTLRGHLGTKRFYRFARKWITSHEYTSQGRYSLMNWWGKAAAHDLHLFFRRWLNNPNQDPKWSTGF